MLHMKYTNDTISFTIHQVQNTALFYTAFIGIKNYKNNNIRMRRHYLTLKLNANAKCKINEKVLPFELSFFVNTFSLFSYFLLF